MSEHWRNDPNLKGRFHPDYPDDLRVIVHDGGPRLTDTVPEAMWVHVVGKRGIAYEGQLLNAPHSLHTVKQGDTILFLAPLSAEFPFRVTEKYLSERNEWTITPCDTCGFAELFDAPSDLLNEIFHNLEAGGVVEAFTSFCPLCGGVQIIELKSKHQTAMKELGSKRWKFWK